MTVIRDLARVEGPSLALRLVKPDDAEFIFNLRTNPMYDAYLSKVGGTIADQRHWIEAYKERERRLAELYYLIERLDDSVSCGLVRLYHISNEKFTWGSWILDHNKPSKAALESAVLIYTIGFELLDIPRSVFDVRIENKRTIAFHERFGARQTHATDVDVHFELAREKFLGDKPELISLLNGGKKS